ncbi:hypothetical protein B0H65DRAFT_446717 [Neurospora tetraspora]|uniref:Uncharacterized protein n=1 Tax=Neurospora tetraspora TaxID=94610 RepID=A0AAE0J1N4_9PEZI|nr:hypothetical protein B0H65DRAFT_446717 [Neurospora tetraspora]
MSSSMSSTLFSTVTSPLPVALTPIIPRGIDWNQFNDCWAFVTSLAPSMWSLSIWCLDISSAFPFLLLSPLVSSSSPPYPEAEADGEDEDHAQTESDYFADIPRAVGHRSGGCGWFVGVDLGVFVLLLENAD